MNRYQSLDDVFEVLIRPDGIGGEYVHVRHISNPTFWIDNLREHEIQTLVNLLQEDAGISFEYATTWSSPLVVASTDEPPWVNTFRLVGRMVYGGGARHYRDAQGLHAYLTCVVNTTDDHEYVDDVKNIPPKPWHQIVAYEPLSNLCSHLIPITATVAIDGHVQSTWQLILAEDEEDYPTIAAKTTLIADKITNLNTVKTWRRRISEA